jgi:hypothetical protein
MVSVSVVAVPAVALEMAARRLQFIINTLERS